MNTTAATPGNLHLRYQISGMDCTSCARKIEMTVGAIPQVKSVKVSLSSGVMSVELEETLSPESIEQSVRNLGYQVGPVLTAPHAEKLVATEETSRSPAPASTESYRTALLTVALLNGGYGVIEMVGGFMSGSQALKADALDFLGDGSITYLGILAIGWSLGWRAKSALLQATFLGLLGIGILVGAAYRILVMNQPQAEMMGILGVIGLAINVTAAIILLRHRHGDANVRAVWLFSRNDAIGNVAVVIAAGLVAWTNTHWPDLLVAVVMAGLFLQSAWAIGRDARQELRELNGR